MRSMGTGRRSGAPPEMSGGAIEREAKLAADARRAVARRSALWFAGFAGIFTRALKRDFHAVRLSNDGPPPAPDTPALLVYSNHPSWWDAAIYAVLMARLFPGRAGHAPIDDVMMSRYGFMGRIGAFGVAQNSMAGAAAFLATSAHILSEPRGMLFVTAQGRFADPRERPVRLAPGLVHLVDRVPGATLVPLALDYPFWDERKPELLLRFGEPMPARALADLSRTARHDLLARHLEATQDELAAEAIARDAAAFQVLVGGSAGVGGVYDLWRRARAAAGGKQFVAAHGGQP